MNDHSYMQEALALAWQGLGRVAPNPSVGCVVVKDDVVVGQARTADGGRPHAETQALAQAAGKAQGATAYVTLEPCNTHGKTPPCVDALIAAHIKRLVIACADPYQKNQGGLERLRQAGIEVVTGICEAEALALNEGFFTKILHNRPFVTVKVATSLDGRIATHSGHSQWITSPESRQRGHEFRAVHDAILVGINTVLADDPFLTVRLPNRDYNPVRIVIDKSLKLPLHSQLVKTAEEIPVWVICSEAAVGKNILAERGVKMISLPDENEFLAPLDILRALAHEGLTRLYIEGGGRTIAEFLRVGLVDQLIWFRAPKLIGGDGVPAFGALGVNDMTQAFPLVLTHREDIGADMLEIWRRPAD